MATSGELLRVRNELPIEAAKPLAGLAAPSREVVRSIDEHVRVHGAVDTAITLEPILDDEVENELDRKILSYCQRFDIQTGLLNHQAIQDALVKKLKNRPAGLEVALIWIDLVNLRREFSLWGWTGAEALARRVAGMLRSVVDAGTLLGRVGGRCGAGVQRRGRK
jgi:GGDEF domain-containing protein